MFYKMKQKNGPSTGIKKKTQQDIKIPNQHDTRTGLNDNAGISDRIFPLVVADPPIGKIVWLIGAIQYLDPLCIEADFDADGNVDMDDFGVMQDAFIVCEQDGIDCNDNGVGDTCELLGPIATDCDANGQLDECDIVFGAFDDCNLNWINDSCDIASQVSWDFNANTVPDECEGFDDCNFNGIGDPFDIDPLGTSDDCDTDLIPDECELFAGDSYFMGYTDGNIIRIDPLDPGEPYILTANNPLIEGMAASCNGAVWGLLDNGSVVEVDRYGRLTTIGLNPQHSWYSATYDCANDVLYGMTSGGSSVDHSLYRISTLDGSAEFIGEVRHPIPGLAFDPVHGILYGYSSYLLWRIDTDTAWATLL